MPMGEVNASALFSWMMEEKRQILQKKANEIPLPHTITENNIDDIFLAVILYKVMIACFDIVEDTLKRYRY